MVIKQMRLKIIRSTTSRWECRYGPLTSGLRCCYNLLSSIHVHNGGMFLMSSLLCFLYHCTRLAALFESKYVNIYKYFKSPFSILASVHWCCSGRTTKAMSGDFQYLHTYLYTFTNSTWQSEMIKKTQEWWTCTKDSNM